MFPLGEASGAAADDLSRRYAWQIPFLLDVGGRFARSFFVGGYLGFGIGSTGSDARVDAACNDDDDNGKNDIACSAASFRIGVELEYSFAPDQRLNPWIGYGIGFEGASASIKDDYAGLDESDSSTGITFADFKAGFDLRHKVGFGPFIDLALGQYRQTTTDLGGRGKYRYTIEERALHAWLTLGLRFVVNP
jgi:hypothetical protein